MARTRGRNPRRGGSVRPLLFLFLAVIVVAVVILRLHEQAQLSASERSTESEGCAQVGAAFSVRSSGVWLGMSGRVVRLLPDSDGARRHQRFVVRCPNGQTVLIVNDVSIGTRVPVHAGDVVAVRGQYIWNSEGGLIHFTHQSSGGSQGGWILFDGRLYSFGSVAMT